MAHPGLVADVVQTWLARGADRRTAVFATSIAHSTAPVRPADRGEAVLFVGYGKPRVQVANHTACRVVDFDEQGVFQLDCPLTSGASGAPVLRETETGYEIIGIVSATNSTRSVAYWFGGEGGLATCNSAIQNKPGTYLVGKSKPDANDKAKRLRQLP